MNGIRLPPNARKVNRSVTRVEEEVAEVAALFTHQRTAQVSLQPW